MFILCGCCYFITFLERILRVILSPVIEYKYFCKLSLGLKFGEFYFGFTGYKMPMSKASKIWNKLSRSLSVIYIKRPVCLCLNPSSICMHIDMYG